MCVLTADERFAVIFCKELFDGLNRWIHLAFHIAGVIVAAVMEQTFVMNQTGRILSAE